MSLVLIDVCLFQSIFPVCYEEHKVVAIKDLHQKDSGLSPTLVSVNLVGTFVKYRKVYVHFALTLFSFEKITGFIHTSMNAIALIKSYQAKQK